MNVAEQLLVSLIRAREFVIKVVDSVRPRIILKHDISYYRRMVFGEVYVEDLAKALGASGRIKVTY